MTILRSSKFILRPIRKGDEKDILKNINEKLIHKNTSRIPYPYTEKDAKDWIKKNEKESRSRVKSSIVWAVDINDKLVGAIGVHHIIKDHKGELGYWLGKDYRGQGIMTKATKLVLRYAFKELNLKRVYAKVYVFNPASKKVLEKAGLRVEGIGRKETKKNGKFVDVCHLAKVR